MNDSQCSQSGDYITDYWNITPRRLPTFRRNLLLTPSGYDTHHKVVSHMTTIYFSKVISVCVKPNKTPTWKFCRFLPRFPQTTSAFSPLFTLQNLRDILTWSFLWLFEQQRLDNFCKDSLLEQAMLLEACSFPRWRSRLQYALNEAELPSATGQCCYPSIYLRTKTAAWRHNSKSCINIFLNDLIFF